ncbi:MAG: diphosphomevalonate decarboxylase [Chloroflexi bacterium]|nr:diphosphomevalonate decarboxylase [Chloroflexota bacterium]
MSDRSATAAACANIAFIKYWGNRDDALRIPANGSLSMNLDGLYSQTRVTFGAGQEQDSLIRNGVAAEGPALQRVSRFLEIVRQMAGVNLPAQVVSRNNFPTGAGIASSAAAFAALSLAASQAIGLDLDEKQLSRLARRGSGSASRSVPGGFVEWLAGSSDEDSYAVSIAPPTHWDLRDCIAIVAAGHKPVGSTEGHALAGSSPLQAARVADTPRRLERCRQAVARCDFARLAELVELDSNLLHAVMMTSTPPLFYWEPASIQIMKSVQAWRKEGLHACSTLDAGPNVHVICTADDAPQAQALLEAIPGVSQVLVAGPGPGAHRVEGADLENPHL